MRATHLLIASLALLVGCEKLGGGKPADPSDPAARSSAAQGDDPGSSSTTSSSSSSGSTGVPASSAGNAPPPAVPASAANTPNPEHVTLRAGYGEENVSVTVDVDRAGVFRLERKDPDAPRDTLTCGGTLSADVVGNLWKGVDAAAFTPPESGFAKPVVGSRQTAGAAPAAPPAKDAGASPQQARWTIARIVADLTMVPSNEATAKTLVPVIRAAVAKAEEQSTGASCSKKR